MGVTRNYIKELITVTGAIYSPELSIKTNFLLISNENIESPKLLKAKEWSVTINTINWIEKLIVEWINKSDTPSPYVL